jgi:hypothetical protein
MDNSAISFVKASVDHLLICWSWGWIVASAAFFAMLAFFCYCKKRKRKRKRKYGSFVHVSNHQSNYQTLLSQLDDVHDDEQQPVGKNVCANLSANFCENMFCMVFIIIISFCTWVIPVVMTCKANSIVGQSWLVESTGVNNPADTAFVKVSVSVNYTNLTNTVSASKSIPFLVKYAVVSGTDKLVATSVSKEQYLTDDELKDGNFVVKVSQPSTNMTLTTCLFKEFGGISCVSTTISLPYGQMNSAYRILSPDIDGLSKSSLIDIPSKIGNVNSTTFCLLFESQARKALTDYISIGSPIQIYGFDKWTALGRMWNASAIGTEAQQKGCGKSSAINFPFLIKATSPMERYSKVVIDNEAAMFHNAPVQNNMQLLRHSNSIVGKNPFNNCFKNPTSCIDWGDTITLQHLWGLTKPFTGLKFGFAINKMSFSWKPKAVLSVQKTLKEDLLDGMTFKYSGPLKIEMEFTLSTSYEIKDFSESVAFNPFTEEFLKQLGGTWKLAYDFDIEVKPTFDMSLNLEIEEFKAGASTTQTIVVEGLFGIGFTEKYALVLPQIIHDLNYQHHVHNDVGQECKVGATVGLRISAGLEFIDMLTVSLVYGLDVYYELSSADVPAAIENGCQCFANGSPQAWKDWGIRNSFGGSVGVEFIGEAEAMPWKHDHSMASNPCVQVDQSAECDCDCPAKCGVKQPVCGHNSGGWIPQTCYWYEKTIECFV